MIGLALSIAFIVFLRFTKRGKKFSAKCQHRYMVWKVMKFVPWLDRHKDNRFLKAIENSSLFPWYGKRVVYVKPKDPAKLSMLEKTMKDALASKDYEKALKVLNALPVNAKTVSLRQIIEAKMQ